MKWGSQSGALVPSIDCKAPYQLPPPLCKRLSSPGLEQACCGMPWLHVPDRNSCCFWTDLFRNTWLTLFKINRTIMSCCIFSPAICSFFITEDCSVYWYTTICLSIHMLMAIYFRFVATISKAAMSIMYKSLYGHMCSFLWAKYLGEELWGLRVSLCLTFIELTNFPNTGVTGFWLFPFTSTAEMVLYLTL